MSVIHLLRMICLWLVIIALLSFVLRSFRDKHPIVRTSRSYIIIAILLITIATITSSQTPTTLLMRMICVITTHQSMMFVYFSFRFLDEQYSLWQLIKSKLYVFVLLLTSMTLVLEYLRRDNLGSFIDNETFRPTIIYYMSYVLFYSVVFIVSILILRMNWKSWGISSAVIYRSRMVLNMLTFGLICCGPVLVYVNLLFSILYGDKYRLQLNELYQGLKIVIGLTVISTASVASLITACTKALRPLHARWEAQQQLEIQYLWVKITDVVPAIRLSPEPQSTLRCLIEIDDAREIIWSHRDRRTVITAREEANLLYHLLQTETIFSNAGPYRPPSTYYRTAKHNHFVVKQLKHLEQRYSRTNGTRESSQTTTYSTASRPPISRES